MSEENNTKVCSKCGVEKNLDMFCKNRNLCKECRTNHNRVYREKNKDRIETLYKKYKEAHREELLVYGANYRATHKEKMAIHNKNYNISHKEQLKAYSNIYYTENKEQLLAKARTYSYKNREKISARSAKYYANNKEKHLQEKKAPAKFRVKSVRNLLKYYEEYSTVVQNSVEYVLLPCKQCGELFQPSIQQVDSRLRSILGKLAGDNHLYCSDSCKQNCDIYNRKKYSGEELLLRGGIDRSREIQPELRAMCLERDYYSCIKCGSQEDLECHHFEGVELNPILSADLDNVVTYCSNCHLKAHQEIGCRYSDLRRKSCLVE